MIFKGIPVKYDYTKSGRKIIIYQFNDKYDVGCANTHEFLGSFDTLEEVYRELELM